MKPRRDAPLRGVEIFNLTLLRDLIDLDYDVTFPVVSSWRGAVEEHLGDRRVHVLTSPDSRIDVLNLLIAALKVCGDRFDTLLLGNTGKSLGPLIRVLHWRRTFRNCVLIAHREATAPFAKRMAGLPGHVLAVNEVIARPFAEYGHPSVHVDYGIVHGNRFFPAEARHGDEPVRFCLFGALDNAWKGADTAIRAFQRLPDAVRDRCELHLASYSEPPNVGDRLIKTYPWIDSQDVPDFLRSMDVMLVPSRDEEVMRETFSQVMVQGMLTGLPLIVSDLPILTEKLDQGGGVACKDTAAFARSMERLATDPALRRRLGEEARHTALDRYLWDTRRFGKRYLAGTEDSGGKG